MNRILLLFAIFFSATVAHGEACTLSGTGDWGPIGTWTGTDDCTPSSDDSFTITGTATVIDDITQDFGAIGITVASGGTLSADVTDHSGDSIIITIGDNGLNCQAGSTCTFAGGYRQFGDATPVTQTTPQRWTFGDYIPCPSAGAAPDCNAAAGGDPSNVRITYPSANYDTANGQAGDTYPDESFGDIVAAEDVLCFWDFDRTDKSAPVDDAFCYEITATDPTTADFSIDFDVDQGTLNQVGYPLARRRIVQTVTTAAAAVHTRTVCTDGTTASAGNGLGADGDLKGRWIRFEDGSGNPLQKAYKILATDIDNAGCGGAGFDLITVGDLNGWQNAVGSGDDVWIDYGWYTGDTFFVMAPIRLKCAAAAAKKCPIELDGTTSINGFVSDISEDVDIDDGPITEWEHLWFKDIAPTLGLTVAIHVDDIQGAVFGHTTITGGSDLADCPGACDRTHMFNFVDTTATVNDYAARHVGDDSLTIYNTPDDANVFLTVNRMRSQFVSDSAQTCDFISSFGQNANYDSGLYITDAICDDCTTSDGGTMDSPTYALAPGSYVNNVLQWGSDGFINVGSDVVPINSFSMKNYMRVGGTANYASRTLLPCQSDGFVVREASNTNALGWLQSNQCTSMKNGIAYDLRVGDDRISQLPDTTTGLGGIWENVAYINVYSDNANCGTNVCALAYGGSPDAAQVVKNMTFAWTEDADTLNEDYVIQSTDADTSLQGILIAHHQDGGAGNVDTAVIAHDSSVHGVGCFFDNQVDAVAADLLDFTSVIRDTPPGFVDRAKLRFDLLGGSAMREAGCGVKTGASAPGIKKSLWFHWLSRLEPEYMGPGGMGGGGSFQPSGIP